MSAVHHAVALHHAVVVAASVPHVMIVVNHSHVVRATVTRLSAHLVRLASALGLIPRKKITAVTPTWKRAALLASRCIPSVQAQTYTGLVEHVVVSDGPDAELVVPPELGIRLEFLPVHEPAPNRGIWARRRGADLAEGDLIAYLDDDNAWRPGHLELLATALESSGADFAYSRARCTAQGLTWTIGSEPPQFGQIDTSLIVHRRELLETATWEPSPVTPADWHLVRRWVDAGARWVHVPRVTLDYYCAPAPAAV